MGGELAEYMDLEYVGPAPVRAGPFRQYAWPRRVAPMVTLTRMVDGVPDGSIQTRGSVGENGAITIGAPEFFAPRPCDEGKEVTFTASMSLSGGPHLHPIPAALRSQLPGYARALAALQRKGAR